jgi:hypothetical protein
MCTSTRAMHAAESAAASGLLRERCDPASGEKQRLAPAAASLTSEPPPTLTSIRVSCAPPIRAIRPSLF